MLTEVEEPPVNHAVPPATIAFMAAHAPFAAISTNQFFKMYELGILSERPRVELINGVLVCVKRAAEGTEMGMGTWHATIVALLNEISPLFAVFGVCVRCEKPFVISADSCTFPDGLILRGTQLDYLDKHPAPADVACVVEVSDTSLENDRTAKLAAYAGARIEQYIIVNIVEKQIEVYEQPVELSYRRRTTFKAGEKFQLRVSESKSCEIAVDKLLPRSI